MYSSGITVPFLGIEFVNPCAKGEECFGSRQKDFSSLHQVLKIIPYFVFLSYLSHDFLIQLFYLVSNFWLPFFFLDLVLYYFSFFHLVTLTLCFMYFPFSPEPSIPPVLMALLVALWSPAQLVLGFLSAAPVVLVSLFRDLVSSFWLCSLYK